MILGNSNDIKCVCKSTLITYEIFKKEKINNTMQPMIVLYSNLIDWLRKDLH